MTSELNRERVKALAAKLSQSLVEHLNSAPTGNGNVYEALNAFAMVSAFVLAGTGNDSDAWKFFDKALKRHALKAAKYHPGMSQERGSA